jgi:DNA-binding transcriptional regulator YiaG
MISRTISKTRERLGESQAEFAKHFGVNQSTIQRWESQKYEIPARTAKLIEIVIFQLGLSTAKAERGKNGRAG